MRFALLVSLIATTQATWDVVVHNNKIEGELEHIMEDGEKISESTAFQHYAKRMERANMKAKIEIDAAQKEVMYPITKGIRQYLHWFTPDQKDCNVDAMTHCMMGNVTVEEQTVDHDWIACGQQSKCDASWSTLTWPQKEKLMKKFGKTEHQLQKAVGSLAHKIEKEFKAAKKEEAENHKIIMEDYEEDVKSAMNRWGCNNTCVDKQNITKSWNPIEAFQKCDCPLGFEVKTPAGDVIVGAEVESQTEELAANVAAPAAAPAALSVKFNTSGYTFLVVCIFVGQLALVIFLKYFWLKRTASNADKEFWERNRDWKEFQRLYHARCKQERETFKKHLEDMDQSMDQ